MYDYFYGQQADQFNFIRIPAVLFSKEEFKGRSSEAKVLYGIILKRMDLSAKNGWFDEQDRVFIICTLEEIMETMIPVFTGVRFWSFFILLEICRRQL